MSRWAPDAAERLHAAALELFVEQGFAATTVPEITARAGLTTRSFFRHYADKREVLFTGEDELPAVVARVFAGADPSLTPLEVVHTGLCGVLAPRLERLRPELLARRAIVRQDEGLRERELRKLAVLHSAAVDGFRERGLDPLDAEVAGRLATTVYDTALDRWLQQDPPRPLGLVITEVTDAFRRMAASGRS